MGYYDVLRQRVTLAGERLTLHTKAGVVPWTEVESALMLIAESVEITPGMKVLILESGAGALAVWAARRGAEVHCYDGSLAAVRMTRATLEANGIDASVYDAVAPSPGERGTFDLALMPIPKGRAYARTLLGAAARALRIGGKLYLAGPNAGGAKAIVADAGEVLGRSATVRTKARNRLGVAVRLAHAQGAPLPGESFHEFQAADLKLFGTPGVFSWDALDAGTAMLLDTLDEALCADRRVLDVGCGVGVIGMAAARLQARAVDLVDAAWLAVACTQEGLRANNLTATCSVWPSDLYADVDARAYDLILSNPPFHVGHGVETGAAEALIAGAYERLAKRGRLRIVANAFLPYDRLMAEVFGAHNVQTVREDTRYRVLEAVR
ncbi:MAG: class I SAM-dependent methyltransferase [Anaerolineae bacterium]